MIHHLTTEHSSIVNERQVSTYADLCEREIDDSDMNACPICLDDMSLAELYDHLATHMEELALFVLPPTPDDNTIVKVAEHSVKAASSTRQSDAFKDATADVKSETKHGGLSWRSASRMSPMVQDVCSTHNLEWDTLRAFLEQTYIGRTKWNERRVCHTCDLRIVKSLRLLTHAPLDIRSGTNGSLKCHVH